MSLHSPQIHDPGIQHERQHLPRRLIATIFSSTESERVGISQPLPPHLPAPYGNCLASVVHFGCERREQTTNKDGAGDDRG